MKSSMHFLFILLIALAACTSKQEQTGNETQNTQMQTPPPADRDISIPTLVKLDPAIQKYEDAVQVARKDFERTENEQNRKKLVEAYIAFGDYMTYDSPVSPRQGKYHRALVEYYAAKKLDPSNQKVASEIQQIEDIYHSMGREVPSVEEVEL